MSADHSKTPITNTYSTSIGNKTKTILSEGNAASEIEIDDATESLGASGGRGQVVSVGVIRNATLEQLLTVRDKTGATRVVLVGEFAVQVYFDDAKSRPSATSSLRRNQQWTLPLVPTLLSVLVILAMAILFHYLAAPLSGLRPTWTFLPEDWRM